MRNPLIVVQVQILVKELKGTKIYVENSNLKPF